MKNQQDNYNFQKIVATTGVVLFLVKLTAWYLTNSVAILTDALEGIVNVISAFVGLYSLYLSSLPKDKNHPYGHGKVEFISAALEGVMISFAGLWIIFEAINHLINPQQIKELNIGIVLIVIAAIVNFIIGFIAVKKGQKTNSIALIASGKHLISDTLTTIGVIIGLAIILFTKVMWIDSVVALIFGVIIIFTGYQIIRKSISGIMDEADEDLLKKLVECINNNRNPNWIDLHNLRIIKYGSILHIDCHMTLPWFFSIKDAHIEIEAIERVVQQEFGKSVELFVHSDYCQPISCTVCTKKDCNHRVNSFEKQLTWNIENVRTNQKHQA
ncbi:MAG: cation diffusion facilitator family transporter [Flavobacteriales bacterium]